MRPNKAASSLCKGLKHFHDDFSIMQTNPSANFNSADLFPFDILLFYQESLTAFSVKLISEEEERVFVAVTYVDQFL